MSEEIDKIVEECRDKLPHKENPRWEELTIDPIAEKGAEVAAEGMARFLFQKHPNYLDLRDNTRR